LKHIFTTTDTIQHHGGGIPVPIIFWEEDMQMPKLATFVGSIAALFAAVTFDSDSTPAPAPPSPTAVEIADAVDHAQELVDGPAAERDAKRK
jgi:hypothetical protein